MEWIDEGAGLVGIRHSQCNVITASADNLNSFGVYSIGQQAEGKAGQKRKQLRIQRKIEGF